MEASRDGDEEAAMATSSGDDDAAPPRPAAREEEEQAGDAGSWQTASPRASNADAAAKREQARKQAAGWEIASTRKHGAEHSKDQGAEDRQPGPKREHARSSFSPAAYSNDTKNIRNNEEHEMHETPTADSQVEEDELCDVCRVGTWTDQNMIVFCEGENCEIAVHQACYGVKTIPDDEWFCDPCKAAHQATDGLVQNGSDRLPRDEITCSICHGRDGALVQAQHKGPHWFHPACILSVPETYTRNRQIYGLGTPSLEQRTKLQCAFCTRSTGVCLKCSVRGCSVAYHVRCGQRAGASFTELASAANKPTMCATHSHISPEDELVAPNYRPISASRSKSKSGVAASAPRLTQPGNFEDSVTRDAIRSVTMYTCADLWRDVGARADNITDQPAFSHLLKMPSKNTGQDPQSPLSASKEKVSPPSPSKIVPQHARIPETTELYRLLRRDDKQLPFDIDKAITLPNEFDVTDASSGHMRAVSNVRRNGPHANSFSFIAKGDTCEILGSAQRSTVDEQNAFPIGLMRFGVRPSQAELVYDHLLSQHLITSTLAGIKLRSSKALAGKPAPNLANASLEDILQSSPEASQNVGNVTLRSGRMETDAEVLAAIETHALLDNLRARVNTAIAANDPCLKTPHPDSKEIDETFKRLFGRCGICGNADCAHKRKVQMEEYARVGDLEEATVYSDTRNERMSEIANMSLQEIHRERSKFAVLKRERLAFIRSEGRAIETKTLRFAPKISKSKSAVAEVVEYLVNKVALIARPPQDNLLPVLTSMTAPSNQHKLSTMTSSSSAHAGEAPGAAAKRQEKKKEKEKERSTGPRKRKRPAQTTLPCGKALVLTIRRTGESSFAFVRANPRPIARENVTLYYREHIMNLSR
ncbi:Protein Jade-1 [Hondaea fermentalgiana]|uniref:Protein Jade-1 n=1 Tax=Hondaea fermentalgiana TaxID=2315210 RepID=A0A2R5GAT5_9STRA|nr:Protein Jade-1 [Hondaea fermentalgiana]|eukprot:GBG24804.1 Protein Jade-1 [Hondaea fermentalgiana]